MATNKGNEIIASSSCLSNTLNHAQTRCWADRVEEFSSNLNQKNAFINEDYAHFFVIKWKEGDFLKTSLFLIQKAIQSVVGEPKTIKKLKPGELLIELQSNLQTSKLKKLSQLANIPIIVSAHKTLNSCRGVISETDLQYISDEEILENLKDQNVTNVQRIVISKENKKINTKHLILTFASTNLPKTIKAGYLQCSVRPYIPNPLRCFKCQRFGHSKTSCRGTLTCSRCSAVGHESVDCNEPYHCVNCKGDHPSYSRTCEKWKFEKEIQTVRTKQGISYPEARKIVESRTPIAGISYAAIASKTNQKSYKSIATQTDNPTNSQSINNKSTSIKNSHTKSQTYTENSIKNTTKPPKTPNSVTPSTSKLSMPKNIAQNICHTKDLNIQSSKIAAKKNHLSKDKTYTISQLFKKD